MAFIAFVAIVFIICIKYSIKLYFFILPTA